MSGAAGKPIGAVPRNLPRCDFLPLNTSGIPCKPVQSAAPVPGGEEAAAMPIVSLESDKPSGDRPVGKDTTPLEPDKTSASLGFAGDGNRLTSPASGSSAVEIGFKFFRP